MLSASEPKTWLRSPVTIVVTVLGMVFAAYELAGVLTMLLANIALVIGVWTIPTLEVAFSAWIKRVGLYRNSVVLLACAVWGFSALGVSYDIAAKRVSQLQNISVTPERPSLPGFSMQAIIAIKRSKLEGRQYITDTGIVGGERISEYISPNEVFTYSVTDSSGEQHTIEAPLGTNGIPFEEWVYLTCEMGVSNDWSFMRIVVNGNEVAYTRIPERLIFEKAGGTIIGSGKAQGDHGGPLALEFLAVYKVTFSNAALKSNESAAKRLLPNLYDHPPFSLLHEGNK